ncbi:glycosyltransferase family 4 protein [Patescibacteria group bacterium]|nr:glycosyltransferase family 4 protein [Patescibacteria group bacterium]
MRIGIDARLWSQTGVGRYIRNLVVNLQKIDKKNHYVLFVRKEDLEDIRPEVKNRNWKIAEANIRWHSVSEQIYFHKILENEYLDLVHFPYISVPVFYKRPFVVTVHDLIPYHYSTGKASTLPFPLYFLKRLGYKFVLNNAVRNSKKILVPLNAVKNDVAKTLNVSEDKISVTYEGCDDKLTVKLHGQTGPNYKVLDGKYFIYVGNAYPHKNLDRLLEAFSLVQKEFKDLRLVFVGRKDIFYRALMAKARQYGLEDKIYHYSGVSDNDLTILYKNALALVFPSLMEGFGLPVLEAMAIRCPVVASDIPSLKELAGDSIIYFSPFDTEQIKRALVYVYKGNYESKRVDKAYEISKHFSWRKMAEDTLKIYESSIGI